MDAPKPRSVLWMFPLVLAFAFAVFGIGVYMASRRPPEFALLTAGTVSVFIILGIWCLAMGNQFRAQADQHALEQALKPVAERLQQISVMLNMISEQQLISERAKGIAFRDNERETLRRAIREEINKKDYEAALALAADMERVFGYRQEAETFRAEIDQVRKEESRKVVAEAMEVIDRHCRAEQWTQALREAQRVMAALPTDEEVKKLPQEIENRRVGHKKSLLDAWNAAISRHDVDGGVEILKQLDPYLTPAEAQEMQEAARRLLKDKLQLLGQQFTTAVKDHRWAEAIQIGQALIAEYPNARMAQEVREKLDLLRQRAAQPEGAAA